MPIFFFYISFVPVVLGIVLGGLVIYWDHRRDMALIEKGLYQPVGRSQSFLAWGLVALGIGVGLFSGSFWVGMPEVEIGGLVATFVGIALLILSGVIRGTRLSQ